MKLLFIPKGKSEDLLNYSINEISSKELDEIKLELNEIDKKFELKTANIGFGADWVLILAVLSGLMNIFLLGEKIETGIKGWVKLGKRLKSIFKKSDTIYFDKDIAIIIAVEYLAKKITLASVKLIMEAELPIKDIGNNPFDRTSKDFIANPYSVYFLTFEVNDNTLISLGVRSDGIIDEHYFFDKDDYHPF